MNPHPNGTAAWVRVSRPSPVTYRLTRLLSQNRLESPKSVSDDSPPDDPLIRTFAVALNETASVAPLVSNLVLASATLDPSDQIGTLPVKYTVSEEFTGLPLRVRSQYREGNGNQILRGQIEWPSMGRKALHAGSGTPRSASEVLGGVIRGCVHTFPMSSLMGTFPLSGSETYHRESCPD